MSNKIGQTLLTSIVSAAVMGAAPEMYQDLKKGLSSLAEKVRKKREEQKAKAKALGTGD
jgi:hypothetical protein